MSSAHFLSMQQIAELPENSQCADCNAPHPNWASINLGTFICINCAGIHRNLGVHISKVRSINLDTSCWEPDLIEFMLSMGNMRSREIYEKYVPDWYITPLDPLTSDVIRENWIRAKYVRKEFQEVWSPNKNKRGLVTGYLTKRSATHKNRSRSRYFILFGTYLIYFNKASSSFPSGEIDLSNNAKIVVPGQFAPDLAVDAREQEHCNLLLQVVTPDRQYNLIAPDAESLFLWAHCLRQATSLSACWQNANKSEDTLRSCNLKDVKLTFSSETVLHTGILSKQGGKRENWKKRYFVMCNDKYPKLLYFKERPDTSMVADGSVVLPGAMVTKEYIPDRENTFTVITRNRRYFFEAFSPQDCDGWVKAIQYAISYHTNKASTFF